MRIYDMIKKNLISNEGMNMNRLYRKNELIFSIMWIVVYVVGLSLADQLSASLGVEKLITVIACMIMTGILINWMKRNDLFKE